MGGGGQWGAAGVKFLPLLILDEELENSYL